MSEKGDRDAQFNLTNMFSEGIGTTQNYPEALKWCWLCALGGEKKCYKKTKKFPKNKKPPNTGILFEWFFKSLSG